MIFRRPPLLPSARRSLPALAVGAAGERCAHFVLICAATAEWSRSWTRDPAGVGSVGTLACASSLSTKLTVTAGIGEPGPVPRVPGAAQGAAFGPRLRTRDIEVAVDRDCFQHWRPLRSSRRCAPGGARGPRGRCETGRDAVALVDRLSGTRAHGSVGRQVIRSRTGLSARSADRTERAHPGRRAILSRPRSTPTSTAVKPGCIACVLMRASSVSWKGIRQRDEGTPRRAQKGRRRRDPAVVAALATLRNRLSSKGWPTGICSAPRPDTVLPPNAPRPLWPCVCSWLA